MKDSLNEIKSLMKRMEETPNGGSNYLINESSIGRLNFNGKIEDFFNTIDIKKGFWVSLGYIQEYPLSKIYPELNKDEFNQGFSNLEQNSRFYGKMKNFINSPEFTNPSGRKYGGFKSMANVDFSSVLLTASYTFNWGNVSSLAKHFEKYRKGELDIRRKYGFGKPEDEYTMDDWRRKPEYKGLGLYPISTPMKNDDGSDRHYPYTNLANGDINLYNDNDVYGNNRLSKRKNGDEYQKQALKFGLADVSKQWKTYYIIDKQGEIDAVSNNLANLFSKPKGISKKFKVDTLQGEEKEFANEMNSFLYIRDRATKEWIIDNIAYIVGTGYDRTTGELLQGARWINPNIKEMFPDNIKQDELQTIIDNSISKSTKDVDDEIKSSMKSMI